MYLKVDYSDSQTPPLSIHLHLISAISVCVQPVVPEQRGDRIKLDQAIAHEIAESPEYDLLAE
jgi:hypothetical protein